MVAHILMFHYGSGMKWAVAGTYPNEACASRARKRFTAFMRPETQFMLQPVKPERQERLRRDNDEDDYGR